MTSKVVGKSYTEQKEEAQEQMAEAQSLEEQQAAELERVGIQDTTAPTETQRAIQREAQERAEMEAQRRAAQQTPIVPQAPNPEQQTSTQQPVDTGAVEAQGQNGGITQGQYTTPSYTTPSYTSPVSAYQSPLTSPFMQSTNAFSMSNPYGSVSAISPSFDSYNIFNPYSSYGMYNQTGSIFSNPYQSSQQQDPTKFKYNPNVYIK